MDNNVREVDSEYAYSPRFEMSVEIARLRTRLQRAEELLQESRSRIAGATNTGQMDQCHDFVQRIDAFLGESHD